MDAPGIPKRKNKGIIPKAQNAKWDLNIQRHNADKAGLHYDIRLSPRGSNAAYSWAAKKIPGPGEKTTAARTDVHTRQYMGFSGTIEEGYGKGTVQSIAMEPVEVLKANNDRVEFNRYRGTKSERYILLRKPGTDEFLFYNYTPTNETKVFENVPTDKASYPRLKLRSLEKPEHVENPNEVWAPKLDGAHNLIVLRGDKTPDIFSYRKSKRGQKRIDHTYKTRAYRERVPKEFRETILRGELYVPGQPGQETARLLNSNVWKSRERQNRTSRPLEIAAFDVVRWKGKDVESLPYREKLPMLKEVNQKIDSINIPPFATSPQEKRELYKSIISRRNPLTDEGIIVYDLEKDRPFKSKLENDWDGEITGTFAATPGSKYHQNAIGGFLVRPEGSDTILRVGSGLDDALRRDAHKYPRKYIGSWAEFKSQRTHDSGLHQAPIFKRFRIEKIMNKSAAFNKKKDSQDLTRKDIAKGALGTWVGKKTLEHAPHRLLGFRGETHTTTRENAKKIKAGGNFLDPARGGTGASNIDEGARNFSKNFVHITGYNKDTLSAHFPSPTDPDFHRAPAFLQNLNTPEKQERFIRIIQPIQKKFQRVVYGGASHFKAGDIENPRDIFKLLVKNKIKKRSKTFHVMGSEDYYNDNFISDTDDIALKSKKKVKVAPGKFRALGQAIQREGVVNSLKSAPKSRMLIGATLLTGGLAGTKKLTDPIREKIMNKNAGRILQLLTGSKARQLGAKAKSLSKSDPIGAGVAESKQALEKAKSLATQGVAAAGVATGGAVGLKHLKEKNMKKQAYDTDSYYFSDDKKKINIGRYWTRRSPETVKSYIKNYKDSAPASFELAKGGHSTLKYTSGTVGDVRKKLDTFDANKGIEGGIVVTKPVEQASRNTLAAGLSSYSERKRKKILGLPIGPKKRVYPYRDKIKDQSKQELLNMLNKKASVDSSGESWEEKHLRSARRIAPTLKRIIDEKGGIWLQGTLSDKAIKENFDDNIYGVTTLKDGSKEIYKREYFNKLNKTASKDTVVKGFIRAQKEGYAKPIPRYWREELIHKLKNKQPIVPEHFKYNFSKEKW